MKKTNLLAVALAFTAGHVCASEPFQYEVGASFSNQENTDVHAVSGTYYLAPLSNGDGPFAEAAFLGRASSISGSFSRVQLDDAMLSNFDTNAWSLGGVYQVEGTGYFVNGGLSRFNGDGEFSYALGGGYYLTDDWAVSVDANFDEDVSYRGATLTSKKIWDLGWGDSVNLEASYTHNDEGPNAYGVGVDYYYSPRVSVGLAHSWIDDFDDLNTGATTVSINGFVTETIQISGVYNYSNVTGVSNNTYGVAVSARF